MKKTTTPATLPSPTLSAFAIAVLTSAAALGLTCAEGCTEGEGFYVAYRTPSGHLARTEHSTTEKAALFDFELAAMRSIALTH